MMPPFFTLLLCGAALVSSFELSRAVDRTSVTLGEAVTLRVKALRKTDEKLRFPGPGAPFGDFEIKDIRRSEEIKGNLVEETRAYELLVFKLGSATIPGVRVVSEADTSVYQVTDPVEIIIKKVSVRDTSDIVDIHGQARVGYGLWFYLTILLVIAALAIGIYLFDRRLRRRKSHPATPEAPAVSPEELFERELAALSADRLLEKGEVKAFHLRISEILRRYLGARLFFYALESTTTELLSELSRRAVTPEARRLVERFCDINDPVKFAKWIPATDVSERLIGLAREIAAACGPKVVEKSH